MLVLVGAGMLHDAHAQSDSIKQIADAVDHHYNQLQSLETHFVETYAGAGIKREESGTLWLKKPGKMRWEYTSPREKLFVSDGKTAWFYVPGDARVQKAPVNKIDDLRSPLRFLLGKTKLNKELDNLGIAHDVRPLAPGDVVLRGIPHGMADRISQIVLEITPEHRIVRLAMYEPDGSTTEFQFSGQKENTSVAEQQFRFSPPPGTEVINTQDLGD